MVHGSLFSGIGGFDLAARIVGWDNAFSCEIDPFCNHVLKYHFPNETQYHDIRHTDFSVWRGRIDVLSGGFPCQPFSQAGKRKGTDDDRHLWPAMLEAIRQVRPRWVVGENVLGIINWNAGMVFEQVCAELEATHAGGQPCKNGHRMLSPRIERKMEQGWAVGLNDRATLGMLPTPNAVEGTKYAKTTIRRARWEAAFCQRHASDSGYLSGRDICGQESGKQEEFEIDSDAGLRSRWADFPTQSPVCGGDDGFSDRLDPAAVFEGVVRSPRAVPFNRWRTESVKAYGNAVVVPLIVQIFRAIDLYMKLYV